jgi:hypothetical protein
MVCEHPWEVSRAPTKDQPINIAGVKVHKVRLRLREDVLDLLSEAIDFSPSPPATGHMPLRESENPNTSIFLRTLEMTLIRKIVYRHFEAFLRQGPRQVANMGRNAANVGPIIGSQDGQFHSQSLLRTLPFSGETTLISKVNLRTLCANLS